MAKSEVAIKDMNLPKAKKEKTKWSITNVYLLMFFWIGINFFWMIRNIFNYIFLMVGQFLPNIPMFIPFGNPLYPSFFGLMLYSLSVISMWLVFTKLDDKFIDEVLSLPFGKKKIGQKRFLFIFKPLGDMKFVSKLKKDKYILRLFVFFLAVFGIMSYFTWYVTAPIYLHVFPFFLQHIATIEMTEPIAMILVGNPTNLLRMFMFIPFIIIFLTCILLWGEYAKYKESFNEGFMEYEFSNRWLQNKIKGHGIAAIKNNEMRYPDVILGPNSENKELVVQPGRDRTLNNIIVGSIGTGKTAALVLPIINQDLHWMTRFINHFPSIYKRDDYKTEHVQGMYLNGLSVIEPSNDLCQKAFSLVKAHGIPEKSVFYIDPTNPNTPNINVMNGPVDKVAEAFAMVMEGLAEGGQGNFFFQQSERNHLKHYIYLLKMHKGETEDDDATFDKLLDMYSNAQLVRRMHLQLKDTFPDVDIDSIEDRDERNHWKIVQQIDEWFDSSLLPRTSRNGTIEKISGGKYHGEEEYYDAKAEYVQGLRNILNDIGASKLLRRVLFGKSDFNMDRHLEYGGVLLCNTAKGELGELSNVLGKFLLLSLQNAVFRRKPDISSYHHIIVDEFPDYVYRPFKEFPAQSRKYKTILTVVCQTVTQLADKYGTTYMQTLLSSLRHKLVYGDVTQFDAELFSKIFGEKEHYEEGTQEQEVSPLQENPTLRMGSSYTRTGEAIMSPSQIIFQREFQAAVKIVKDNRPMPVVQIDANFVPKKEFTEAVIEVEDDNGSFWLKERNKHLYQNTFDIDKGVLKTLQKEEAEATEEEKSKSNKERTDKEEQLQTTQLPDTIPMKSFPIVIDEQRIDEEIETIVHLPKVVSRDNEVEDIIKDLQETFGANDVLEQGELNDSSESDLAYEEHDKPLLKKEGDENTPGVNSTNTVPSTTADDEKRYREERERERTERERQYYEEQQRLSQSTQEQKKRQQQKIQRDVNQNSNHNDFMSDFGVTDADD